MAYDTIIIGAGIAGLSLAALLANDGRHVLVLEREAIPGGQFATLRHAPPEGPHYRFDVTVSPLIGFETDGLYAKLAQRLGLHFPVVPLTSALAVHLPDRVLVASGDPGDWLRERRTIFPEQVLQAEAFWRGQEEMAALFMRSLEAAIIPGFRPELIGLLPHQERQVVHELRRRHLSDPALLAFLDALTLLGAGLSSAMCPWPSGSLALDLPRRPIFYAAGGNGSIAAALVDALIRDGGEIRYSAEVSRMLVADGRINGVELRNGTVLHARRVIYDGALQALPVLLGDLIPTRPSRLIEHLPALWGTYGLAVGVAASAVAEHVPLIQVVIDDPKLPVADGNVAFISTHPGVDHSRAPQGLRALTVTTPVASGPRWDALPQRAELLRERLLAALERAMPGVEAATHMVVPLPPQPPRRHGLRSNGAAVDGLWLLDSKAFPGPRILAALQSAIYLYRRLRFRRAP